MPQPRKPENDLPRRRAFCVLAGFVFLWMLLLNCLTPYIADDFTNLFAFGGNDRVRSLPRLLESLSCHYFEWSGRMVAKVFAQGLLMFPPLVFDLLNAAVYLALGLVIYRLARGRRSGRYDFVVLAFIELSLWLVSPVFGQTNLWMAGATCYLWGSAACLAVLLPWRYWLQKPFAARPWFAPAMAAASLLAAWMCENTSAGLLVCLVLCLGTALVRGKKAPLWMWCSFAGALAGTALLVAAPGNYNRASFFVDERSFLTKYAVRFLTCLDMLKTCALPLLLLFAALFTLLCLQEWPRRQWDVLLWPLILFIGAMGANFAMMASPFYYERSTHGVLSLLTAACAACLTQLKAKPLRDAAAAGAACAAVVCAFTLCEAGYDIASFWMMDRVRDALIWEQSATQPEPYGLRVVTYGIEPYTRWCGAYGLPDIRENGEDQIALCRARWYGLALLTADEVHTYPFPGHTNAAYAAGEGDETGVDVP